MEKKLQDSIEEAKRLLNKVPDSFHGGMEHSKKVVEISTVILGEEREANKDVVIVSAWWHDVGRLYGNDKHEKRSAEMASKDLAQRGFDEKFCKAVHDAIAHHRYDMTPHTLEGIIIRDADKLALLDRKRWQEAISDKNYNKFEHSIHVLPHLKNEILQLEISKKLYNEYIEDFIDFIENESDERFKRQMKEILGLNLESV